MKSQSSTFRSVYARRYRRGLDPDALFLATLDDLRPRVERSNVPPYEIFMAAPLLRKLLMDASPLVDQVNRERKLKIRYPINGFSAVLDTLGIPRPVFWAIQDGLDPETSPPPLTQQIEVKRDQLLARLVMIIGEHEITVRDLIDHVSHVAGAVHAGQPQHQREQALRAASRSIQIGGYPPDTRALQAVGRVVLKGLRPLSDQIRADLGS